ncbi:MAG: hypothetical protein V1908_02125 [Candidatus Peregrinibacteria bacterium]
MPSRPLPSGLTNYLVTDAMQAVDERDRAFLLMGHLEESRNSLAETVVNGLEELAGSRAEVDSTRHDRIATAVRLMREQSKSASELVANVLVIAARGKNDVAGQRAAMIAELAVLASLIEAVNETRLEATAVLYGEHDDGKTPPDGTRIPATALDGDLTPPDGTPNPDASIRDGEPEYPENEEEAEAEAEEEILSPVTPAVLADIAKFADKHVVGNVARDILEPLTRDHPTSKAKDRAIAFYIELETAVRKNDRFRNSFTSATPPKDREIAYRWIDDLIHLAFEIDQNTDVHPAPLILMGRRECLRQRYLLASKLYGQATFKIMESSESLAEQIRLLKVILRDYNNPEFFGGVGKENEEGLSIAKLALQALIDRLERTGGEALEDQTRALGREGMGSAGGGEEGGGDAKNGYDLRVPMDVAAARAKEEPGQRGVQIAGEISTSIVPSAEIPRVERLYAPIHTGNGDCVFLRQGVGEGLHTIRFDDPGTVEGPRPVRFMVDDGVIQVAVNRTGGTKVAGSYGVMQIPEKKQGSLSRRLFVKGVKPGDALQLTAIGKNNRDEQVVSPPSKIVYVMSEPVIEQRTIRRGLFRGRAIGSHNLEEKRGVVLIEGTVPGFNPAGAKLFCQMPITQEEYYDKEPHKPEEQYSMRIDQTAFWKTVEVVPNASGGFIVETEYKGEHVFYLETHEDRHGRSEKSREIKVKVTGSFWM